MRSAESIWRKAVWGAALLAAVAIAHGRKTATPFLDFKDVSGIMGLPGAEDWRNLAALGPWSYRSVFWGAGNYAPVPLAVDLVFRAVFGIRPAALRVLELLLLWTAGLLVAATGKPLGKWAWLAAFLYVLHPIQEGVGFRLHIVTDQLGVVFVLAGLLSHQRARTGGFSLRSSVRTAAWFGLALLCKETSFVFPALLLAHDLLLEGLPPADRRQRWLAAYGSLAAVLALWSAAYIMLVARSTVPFFGYGEGGNSTDPAAQSIALLGRLSGIDFHGASWTVPFALILSSAIMAWSAPPGERRLLAFGGLWAALCAAPFSGLLPIRPLSVLEPLSHYLVCAAVGWCWLIADVVRGLASDAMRRHPRAFRLAAAAATFLAAAATARSHHEAAPESALECPDGLSTPGPRCAASVDRLFLALPEMKRSDPAAYASYRREAEARLGRDATEEFEAYFDGLPGDPCRTRLWSVRHNRDPEAAALDKGMRADEAFLSGCADFKSGELGSALLSFRKSVELDPESAEARRKLAAVLWASGRPEARDELAALATRSPRERHDFIRATGDGELPRAWCRCRPDEDRLEARMTGSEGGAP